MSLIQTDPSHHGFLCGFKPFLMQKINTTNLPGERPYREATPESATRQTLARRPTDALQTPQLAIQPRLASPHHSTLATS